MEIKSDELLTTEEAAERTGLSKRQVQHLISKETLPAIRKGRDWLIRSSDLHRIAEGTRKKRGRPPKSSTDEKV